MPAGPLAGLSRSVADWERMWERLPRWRGTPCQQFPADMWRYAELIFALQPPWVLETGVADGGTALFLADVMACAGDGGVIGIDVAPLPVMHARLMLLQGDAAHPGIVAQVAAVTAGRRGLVLLDDDHSSAQVARELDAYAPMADYLVVEDTIMEHLPRYAADGPHLALAKWLPGHPEFGPDPDPSPTQHPGGWLRRVT